MIGAFPFAELSRWTRSEVAATRRVLRRLLPERRRQLKRGLLSAEWTKLLGGTANATPLVPLALPRTDVQTRFADRCLTAVFDHGALGVFAIAIDAPLAMGLASRALGGVAAAGEVRFGPAQEGALAMLCAQASGIAFAPSPCPRVRAVTETLAHALDALASTEFLVWPWRVRVGDLGGDAALIVRAGATVRGVEPTTAELDDFADAMVEAVLVLARDELRADLVSALAVGDVLGLDRNLLFDNRGALSGTGAFVSFDTLDLPVTCDAGRVTIAAAARPRRTALSTDPPETTGDAPAARTEQIAGLPVEVEVILAHQRVAVGEVAQWRVGEVIAFDARIGGPVLVRAGGRPVARGELCTVDGEVGVRVTELL